MRVEPNEIMDESYMQLLLRKAEGENEVPALGANDFSLFQKDSSEKLHMRVLSPRREWKSSTTLRPPRERIKKPCAVKFASAYAVQVYSLCASATAVYLPFFVFERVSTRLD